jgi:hypothetical protein
MGYIYPYKFLLTMTDIVTSQDTYVSSWDIVYIIVFKKNDYIFFGPNILKEG